MTDFEKRMYVLGMVQALPATARDDFVEEVEKVFSGNGPQAYGAVGIFMAVDDVVGTIVTTL